MTLSHASTSSSSTASTSMRSPQEIDLGRFVSQLGYTSTNPASELLLRPGSLHNLSNGGLKLDLDSSFKSFSFPSLELSKSSDVSNNLSTIVNNKSTPVSETDQPKEDVNEKNLHLLEATNLEKRTIGKNKDEAPESSLNTYRNNVDLKRKNQEDKEDDRGSDYKENNARDSSHATSVECFVSWAERLSSPASLSRNHLSEAPLKMLRSATFSFLELVNVKGQNWVNDMKQKYSHLESKELDNINSLANVKDTLFLDRASIAFKAHPSPIPNQTLESCEKEDCKIVLPISMRIEFNSTAFGENICAKINVPGTIIGIFGTQDGRLKSVNIDFDSIVLLSKMIDEANTIATTLILSLAGNMFADNNPDAPGLVRSTSYVQYSEASVAAIPTLKRSIHLCPSSEYLSSKAKRIESNLGLVRKKSNQHFASIEKRTSTQNLAKKRSAVTWTDLQDDKNEKRIPKRTKNAEWGQAILKKDVKHQTVNSQAISVMKRTISSGASTIVRSMKSSKNATFGDFGRMSSANSLTRCASSMNQLSRPQSQRHMSFTDLKRPVPFTSQLSSSGLTSKRGNSTFDLLKFKQLAQN
mmetsp:Transcript_13683/g.17915  ORF Transcript_13683/g.17915 Transcript_13683/m.17915 type:complete len:584 (-) Transcript_13683:245-1996(-)